MNCDALTPEEAAEVDARTRANLLTGTDAGAEVRIRCELGTATVIAFAGDRSSSAVIALPNAALKEALLEAVERALEALERQTTTPAASQDASGTASPPPSTPAPASTAPHAAAPGPCAPCRRPSASPAGASREPSNARDVAVALGAAALAELWSGRFAYGGRVLAAASHAPWTAGVAVGGLTSATHPDAFTVAEWHALVFASLAPPSLGGIGARVGAGVSTLVASPHSGVAASSGTVLPVPFGEVELERAFHFGRLAVAPELGVRLAARRRIVVDGLSRFALPVLVPQALVVVTYAL